MNDDEVGQLSEEEIKKRHKQRIKHIATLSGVQYIGMIILVLCSGLCLYPYALPALIFAEFAHIFFRGIYTIVFIGDLLRDKIKGFFVSVIPGAVAVVAVVILGMVMDEPASKVTVDYITRAATIILIFPLIIPFIKYYLYDDKDDDKPIYARKLSFNQKLVYRLLAILSRVLVLTGLLLTAFVKPNCNFYFEIITILGCALWAARRILRCICWCYREPEEITVDNPKQNAPVTSDKQASKNNTEERALDDRDVYKIIEKIAKRWSYREETFVFVPGASLRFNVTCEITGYTFITYRISGKLSVGNDYYLHDAISWGQDKLDRAAKDIKLETMEALRGKKLDRSYDIFTEVTYL